MENKASKFTILFASLLMIPMLFSSMQAFGQVGPGFEPSTDSPNVIPLHGNADVSTLGLTNNQCAGLQFDGSNHQRYIPNANNIISVDIELRTLNLASVNPITVNLYQGLGIGGPLLGSTSNDDGNFAAVGQPPQIVHFDFGAPIVLIPGNPYTIEITPNDATSDFNWQSVTPGVLPAPQDAECFNDIIVNTNDFIFATYFVAFVGGELIPLDSTMVLVSGAQYTAAWMIPVIVAGIGFAIVIARKF